MKLALFAVAAAAVLCATPQQSLAQAPAAASKPAATPVPTYTPPQRGAPQRRVGGSSRGIADALPAVMLLAPEHVGHTVSEQPSLYWFVSKPTSVRVEVTLIDDKGERPLIEQALTNVKGPAVHRIDLSAHKVQLKPGVEYQWSIAVVPDPKERSNDVMAGGSLKRVEVPQALAARRAQITDTAELARLYAAEGIWYDAIAAYSELIDQRPGDKSLREARAGLLEQVGLKDVAAYDRRAD